MYTLQLFQTVDDHLFTYILSLMDKMIALSLSRVKCISTNSETHLERQLKAWLALDALDCPIFLYASMRSREFARDHWISIVLYTCVKIK